MKQSLIKSKEKLKVNNYNQHKLKKPVLDYEQYKKQLSFYQKNHHQQINNLFDWSKPSQIIAMNAQQHENHLKQQEKDQNHSMNTDQLLKSEEDKHQKRQNEQYADESFEVELPNKQPKASYLQSIKKDYGMQYNNLSVAELQSQLRIMRQQLIGMNVNINQLLNKYELLCGKNNKKQFEMSNPYKFISKEIQINNKIINNQLEEIKQIQGKDKTLEKKDFLVELNELIIEIHKEIHDTNKDKHNRWVDVQKIDRMLKELQEIQGSEQEYREVKELKIKIVYYFKKLKERKMIQEEFNLQLEKIMSKDEEVNQKLEHYKNLAIQNSLEVSTNKKYIEIKKKFQQLSVMVQNSKKKKQISTKSFISGEQRLQKQITSIRKQIQKLQMQAQEISYQAIIVDEQSSQIIQKNQSINRQFKSMSYKFGELDQDKYRYKPDFKRPMSKLDKVDNKLDDNNGKNNKTIDVSLQNKKVIKDLNQSIRQSSENAEQSSEVSSVKLKPTLRQWKQKIDKQQSTTISPEKYKTIQNSNIFKPSLLIRSKK